MRFKILSLLVVVLVMMFATIANAQATRTWVSGVGDDANPCSRTAPCKTFAGAISKTAANGIINALDDGGFGTVTITKPITIDGGGHIAGVLNSGVTGIIVNTTGASDTVRLVHLDIEGANTGLRGINVIAVHNLIVEDCKIYGQNAASPSGNGIFIGTTAANVHVAVIESTISNNSNQGIDCNASAGSVNLSVEGSHIDQNGQSGVDLINNCKAEISHCWLNQNGSAGVFTEAATTHAHVAHSYLNGNTFGASAGTNSAIFLFASQVSENAQSVNTFGGGLVHTHGNNAVIDNTTQILPSPNDNTQ